MRSAGITELMPLLRLSSFPFPRYASLYLPLSPDNRSPLGVALHLLFFLRVSCSSLLIYSRHGATPCAVTLL